MDKAVKARRFDIQTWIELAESDPDKFEAMRAEAIERVIAASSEKHQKRLRSLQWRVDKLRERSATPMAATIAISRLMWDSFYRLHDSYQDLAGRKDAPRLGARPAASQSAEIIPFPPVRSS
jgi:hypothetical protein